MTNSRLLLTQTEADGVLDGLLYDRADLRDAAHRTDRERLAIGLVCLRKWIVEHKTQRAIGEELKLPQATVHRYIDSALNSIAIPTITAARAEMLQMNDDLLDKWLDRAGTDEKAATIVLKLMEQRARVTGAFAPIEINQTVTEISATERELQLMITEQEAENKISEDGVELEA